MPPSLREWLPENHLAWYVLDAVAEMDLSVFYGRYRVDGWGRPAWDNTPTGAGKPPPTDPLACRALAFGAEATASQENRRTAGTA